MSYPVNQKVNTSVQPTMGVGQFSNINAPQLQNIDLQQDVVQKSALKGVASGKKDKPWLTPVLLIPSWLLMSIGMDKFNASCRGEYKDTSLYKMEKWGEKVGESKLFKSKPMQWLEKTLTSGNKKFMEKIVPKSKILSAMIHTPSEPELGMVKMMKDSTFGEVRMDAIQKLGEYTKEGTDLEQLKKIGLTADEFKAIKDDPRKKENIEKLIEVCKNAGKEHQPTTNVLKIPWSAKLSKSGKPKYLSDFMPFLKKVIGRDVYFTEYANKLHALNNTTSKNWVAKRTPKFAIRLIEGLTNGTAGGKFAILLAALFVADAVKKTMDAPKGNGEKRKTFIENFVYNEAMYLTMPLGLKVMHGVGGLQYLGVSKENLEKFRAEQKTFNEAVKNGVYKDKNVYKAEVKRIKSILKPEYAKTGAGKFFKGILFKPLAWGAKVITVGLENFASFNPKGINKTSDIGKRIGHFFQRDKIRGLKDAAGYPVRFLLYLMVIAPFLGKVVVKISNAIFGKPTKSVLDEGKEDEKKAKEGQMMPNQIPAQPVVQAVGPVVPAKQIAQPQQVARPVQVKAPAASQNQNLLAPYQANQMNKPNQLGVMPTNNPTRRYIPSTEPVKILYTPKVEQQSAVAGAALNRADKAEKNASRYLGERH